MELLSNTAYVSMIFSQPCSSLQGTSSFDFQNNITAPMEWRTQPYIAVFLPALVACLGRRDRGMGDIFQDMEQHD